MSSLWVIGSLVGSAAVIGLVALPMFRNGDSEARADAVLHTVERTLFEHSVVEPGEIESANNVEVSRFGLSGRITAPTDTGPASAPRPASSNPATC